MTDKEKIKEEIERLDEKYRELRVDGTIQQAKEADLVVHVLQQLNNFIDSLPKEPASEDLEEEIDRFAKAIIPSRSKTITRNNLSLCAKHFAEWQHGKDFDDLLQSEMEFPKEFYQKGYDQAKQDFLEKAEIYLRYKVYYNTHPNNINVAIDEFKNYMENENN